MQVVTTSVPEAGLGPGAVQGLAARVRMFAVRRRHILAVGFLTVVTAVFYGVYLATRFKSLNYGLLDLGIYDQAVREYAHFHAPHSPVVALPQADSPGLSQLSDHFTPILAVLAPLYWIHDSP